MTNATIFRNTARYSGAFLIHTRGVVAHGGRTELFHLPLSIAGLIL